MSIRHLLIVLLFLPLIACGPGWDGYQDNYSEPGPVSTEPWDGPEIVFVALDDVTVEVELAGLQTRDYLGVAAVLLSDLIIKSGLTPNPESFYYDFTASDGYDLLVKRYEDVTLLPTWTELVGGYLYVDSRFDDLTAGWTTHPWGSALSAYQVKWMNGGTITLLPLE
jgi:hypothetical protein